VPDIGTRPLSVTTIYLVHAHEEHKTPRSLRPPLFLEAAGPVERMLKTAAMPARKSQQDTSSWQLPNAAAIVQ